MSDILKTIPQYLLPQKLFSRLMGKFAHIKRPQWLKNWAIKKFITHYGVNLSEAQESQYKNYPCFNDFFTRKLLTHLRPIDVDINSIISPADGSISEIGKINQHKLLQAKGHSYSVKDLLGGHQEASLFENGSFATIYLSPKDYHRVHMPYGGHFIKKIHIPGKLFSVNQRTARVVSHLFAKNERTVTFFQTNNIGKIAVILVGAMIVGNIIITAQEDNLLKKADELGYFQLGSTVIILFEAKQIKWREDLKSGMSIKMGQTIGSLATPF